MISSPQNEKLKLVRKLRDRRHREREGLFATEGEDLVEAGLAAGVEPRFRLSAAGSGLAGEEVEPQLLAEVSALGSGTRAIAVWPRAWADAVEPPCVYLHGVGDPVQVAAGRLHRVRPGPRPDGAPAGDLGQQLRLDLLAGEAAARGAEPEARLDTRGQPRLDQVLALGREQALALAMPAIAQLADQLQLLVVGAGNHPVSVRVGRIFSWNRGNEKAGRKRPAREVEVWVAARRPHPPGQARQIGGTPRGRRPRSRRASCG